MREIKFRAWDTEEKCFMNHSRVIESRVLALENNGEGRFIFHQWTGLLDRYGREIYEGDIVKKRFDDRMIGEFYAIGQVVFGKWYAGFMVNYRYDIAHKFERVSSFKNEDGWVVANRDMEVIGNIYENPELLEVSE